jgi:hypothetical protein
MTAAQQARQSAGLSIETAAKRASVSIGYLRRVERLGVVLSHWRRG